MRNSAGIYSSSRKYTPAYLLRLRQSTRERERETFRTDPTPRRLSEGQDGWRPSLTNGQTRASNTKQQMNFLVTDEINVRRSQWDVGSTEKETNGGKDKKQIKKKRK